MRQESVTLANIQNWRVLMGLTGASLLPAFPWRLISDAGGWLADLFDILAVSIVVIQSLVGSPEIGLVFVWLLVAVLTYQYTPILYPRVSETVVTSRGFRGLMAAGVLFFGRKDWATLLAAVTDSTTATVTVDAMVVVFGRGLVIWGTVFGLYLFSWHGQALIAERRDLRGGIARGSGNDFPLTILSIRDRYDVLFDWLRWIVRWRKLVVFSIQSAFFCLLVGFTAVVLNLFYPVPEALLFVGLGVLYVVPNELPSRQTLRYEVDLRLLDAIGGATQNSKGLAMLVSSFIGMCLSGILFSMLFTHVLFSYQLNIDNHGWRALLDAGRFTSLVLVVISGAYSLLHWVRQVERLEPYARRWETNTGNTVNSTLVARPPGLLVPAHVPISIVIVVYFLSPSWSAELFILIHIIAIVAMGWGLIWAWREDPQPLTHESRDLLITLLIESGVMFAYLIAEEYVLTGDIDPKISLGVFLMGIGTCLFYIPDGRKWASQRDGFWSLLGRLPVVFAGLILIRLLSSYENTFLTEGVLVVILITYVLYDVVETYIEWQVTKD